MDGAQGIGMHRTTHSSVPNRRLSLISIQQWKEISKINKRSVEIQ